MAEKPTPEEIGKACAAMLNPKEFEPFVKRAAEDFYERIMYNVQDYLRENTEYNISSELDAARSREIKLLKHLRAIDDLLGVHSYVTDEQRIAAIEILKARPKIERENGRG